MGKVILGSILVAIFIVLILLLIHRIYKKQLDKRVKQIDFLKESLNDIQAKLNEKEKRNAFRLLLLEKECTFELIDFGDKMLEPLRYRRGIGKIRDISRTGMKFSSEIDLPIRKQIILQVHFVLHNEEFAFTGKIVRKEEKLNDISYGIEFISPKYRDQQRLNLVIQKIEIERRNKTE